MTIVESQLKAIAASLGPSMAIFDVHIRGRDELCGDRARLRARSGSLPRRRDQVWRYLMTIFEVATVIAGTKHGDLWKPTRGHCRSARDQVWQSLMATFEVATVIAVTRHGRL